MSSCLFLPESCCNPIGESTLKLRSECACTEAGKQRFHLGLSAGLCLTDASVMLLGDFGAFGGLVMGEAV